MSREPTDANRYLYEQIYSELKEEILGGKYRKGDWFPPERVLKDRFNTTHLTVRNALAKLVLEGYIERYSGKGTLVIYSREHAAHVNKPLRFPYVHVIFAGLDEASARILESLEAQFRKIPLPVHFSSHDGNLLLEQSLYREAEQKGAVVILEPAASTDSIVLSGMALVNTILVHTPPLPIPCAQVVVDHALGARKAVRYLLDLGHRSIALCNMGLPSVGVGIREGFEEELASRGFSGPENPVEICAPGSGGGRSAVQRILARSEACRAFFCATDELAAGAIRGLLDAGLSPGADCSVIGYGNTGFSEAMGLATVDPGFDRLAECVVSLAREGMNRGSIGNEVVRISPELRIRDSGTSARP
ncbi:MAG: GntR family transcriptional regulator [Spirochaetia bacterium]|jgi:DNA-binding LacI/PurR family transcriptional regulator